MEIRHSHVGNRGAFAAYDDDTKAGIMTYTDAGPGKIIIDHTVVDDAFKGKNVGKQMLMAAVEHARKEHLKIMPLCPFAKSVFDRMPEIADVLF